MLMTVKAYNKNNDAVIYTHEVVSITYKDGVLFTVCKDESNELYNGCYTASSLGEGIISIM